MYIFDNNSIYQFCHITILCNYILLEYFVQSTLYHRWIRSTSACRIMIFLIKNIVVSNFIKKKNMKKSNSPTIFFTLQYNNLLLYTTMRRHQESWIFIDKPLKCWYRTIFSNQRKLLIPKKWIKHDALLKQHLLKIRFWKSQKRY